MVVVVVLEVVIEVVVVVVEVVLMVVAPLLLNSCDFWFSTGDLFQINSDRKSAVYVL